MKSLLKYAIIFCLRLPDLLKCLLHSKRNANVIIYWERTLFLNNYLGDLFLRIIPLVEQMQASNIPYSIVWKRKSVGKIRHKTVLLMPHFKLDPYRFDNYAVHIFNLAKRLENQGNFVFPESKELKYWENKIYMYRQFSALDIPFPKTTIIESNKIDQVSKDLEYPCILKEPHSYGSRGLHLIHAQMEFSSSKKIRRALEKNPEIIVQSIVPMKMDIRVIVVGNEVVSSYTRRNLAPEWRPTSTVYGSGVTFNTFPDQWKETMVKYTQNLGLTSAAYDVCWEHDDTNSAPIILEVSPLYHPNPENSTTENYSAWKRGILSTHQYQRALQQEYRKHLNLVWNNHLKFRIGTKG